MEGLDAAAARIAGRQHGLVKREQLLALGFSTGSLERRLAKGWLIRTHRGVYRLGHAAPSLEADYLGAVFACGTAAALSGRAAGFLLGLIPGRQAPDPEVTAPIRRTVPGVETRRSTLDPRDVMTWKGIPLTTPAQQPQGGGAPQSALGRRRAHPQPPRKALHPAPQEARPSAANRPAGGRFVDCRWPDHKLMVELDSYRYHRSRHAFEQDRKRERQAYARRDQFRRYTWGDVVEHPRPTLRELRAVLGPV